jgi:tRNA dimethylallyltransferase
MTKKPKIVVVLGPTACGKSDMAVELARKFNGEIISADSRQVYKGMDIGTGKITKKEMRGIPHYLLDIVPPKKVFTAEHYKKLAEQAIEKIIKKNKLPIICGGTGHYIDTLIYNQQFPSVPPDLKLRKKLEKKTVTELFEELKKLDPERAKTIDPKNPRRLIRALEIIYKTGKPIPKIKSSEKYEVFKIGVSFPKEILKNRIHLRLLRRIKLGMVAEVKGLIKSGVSLRRLEDFGLEYRYLARYVSGKISKNEMLTQLEKQIVDYSKRQMTWFKRDKDTKWIKNTKQAEVLARKFLKS